MSPWTAKRAEQSLNDEAGFSLIELLVAMTIFMVVLGTTLTVLDSAARGVRKDEVRTDAATDAQQGLARMVRELRDTREVYEMTGSVMDVRVRRQGSDVRVRFDCDVPFTPDDPANPYDQNYRRCVRTTMAADPTWLVPPPPPPLSTGQVVLDRICPGTSTTSCLSAATAPVFTCRTAPSAPGGECKEITPPADPDDPDDESIDPDERVWPTLVEINVEVPARGGTKDPIYSHRISFSDGVLLRNLNAQKYDAST